MKAWVRLGSQRGARVPRWMGGRMPLSSELSASVRAELSMALRGKYQSEEMQLVKPFLELQKKWSDLPDEGSVLIEHLKSREGYHIFVYPFEGRLVHEGLAALLAYRISRLMPLSLTLAVNDYGFEVLGNVDFDAKQILKGDLFSVDNLAEDILDSMNASEMSRRQFREIARVAGLVFNGYPGRSKNGRQLQVSSGLLFDVFSEYDPDNLLLHQARREVLELQLEESRLRTAMQRLSRSRIKYLDIERPTPLSMPLLVERMRGKLSSEELAARVLKMRLALSKKPKVKAVHLET
jgi:ATP-dependent Lhr-like helicase